MNPPSALRRRTLFAGLCLLVVLGAVWSRGRTALAERPAAAAATAAVQVTSVRVQAQTVPIYQAGIGTVTAAQSVTVRARIDGQLDQVGFAEGQDVKAGQLLARLDPRTLRAQLAQAQAQRAKDAAQLANARIDLKRITALLGDDAATQQQLDTQGALVAQLEAAVQADDAQIDTAQVQLGFTRITAPIDGRLGARLLDVGNIVHAADAGGLVVINQVDPISVVFTLPEDAVPDVNRALLGTRKPLAVIAYPRGGGPPLAAGELVLLNNQIDAATGTVQLKGRFPNPAHALWPGQYVNVRLLLGARRDALTVPAAAVQRSPDGSYAYVVNEDNTVRSRPIRVGLIQDGLAVIDQGLVAGERVVLDGQYKLKPGASVVEVAAQ
jgi:membrane fusion protein, multidrug efflux system